MDAIGILGAGAMGIGIAHVAAQAGHDVVVCDNHNNALAKARKKLDETLRTLVERGKLESGEAYAIQSRIKFTDHMSNFSNCKLVIEAIIEDLEVKQIAFRSLDAIVPEHCILASNTSSLSISAIAAHLKKPSRIIGIHFFNPATVMKLVEIIPALQTAPEVVTESIKLIQSWGKMTVTTKDTPGFIVNRVARPYYGEALRILDEGIADEATIDWAMKEFGGFKMGPFELMDFIGHDINYKVTETIFETSYFDPRYKPSFTQKRLVDAHWLGKKSSKGFYEYHEGATLPEPNKNAELGKAIYKRVIVMLINEAAEACYMRIATKEDIETAMLYGVNYPKGLLHWADEIGIAQIVDKIDGLYHEYLEDRYRCSPMLRRMAREGTTFF